MTEGRGTNVGSSNSDPARRGRQSKAASSVLTPPVGIPAVPAQRGAPTAPPVAASVPPEVVVAPCVCGHAREAHEHYRPGRDCGACGAHDCADYRRAGGLFRGALRRLGVVA